MKNYTEARRVRLLGHYGTLSPEERAREDRAFDALPDEAMRNPEWDAAEAAAELRRQAEEEAELRQADADWGPFDE